MKILFYDESGLWECARRRFVVDHSAFLDVNASIETLIFAGIVIYIGRDVQPDRSGLHAGQHLPMPA